MWNKPHLAGDKLGQDGIVGVYSVKDGRKNHCSPNLAGHIKESSLIQG